MLNYPNLKNKIYESQKNKIFIVCLYDAVVAVFLASCEDTLEIGKLPDESQYEDIYAKNGYLRDAKSNRVTNIIDLFTENYKTSVRLGLI